MLVHAPISKFLDLVARAVLDVRLTRRHYSRSLTQPVCDRQDRHHTGKIIGGKGKETKKGLVLFFFFLQREGCK